ncbi:hypothetical protein K1T71_003600 [Dendrolimus kikuchii]|uniref:Uncharacterized protein n=1 Tax=Dendrolimus kikuchii TaxID=765133 RepID=A0ACC1DCD7_9NEOP|nr:hypothetical protein K1T71_003600 [Dendrolimus kikuchii]
MASSYGNGANVGASSFNFEKLNGISNYGTWKFLMRIYLIHEDLWDCIEESSANTPIVTDERKQQKALAKICLMILPSSLSHVRDAKTGHDAWRRLQKAYEDRGLCRKLGLLRTLFGLKLEQFKSMENYLMQVCDINQQLCDINYAIEDDFLAVLMLSGLPTDYDPLIMALEHSNIKLTSEIVKTKLVQETMRRDFENSEENAKPRDPLRAGYPSPGPHRRGRPCLRGGQPLAGVAD